MELSWLFNWRWISVFPQIRFCFSAPATRGTMTPPGGSWSPEPRRSPDGRAGWGPRLVSSAAPPTRCLWYRWTARMRRGTRPCSSPRRVVTRTWSGSYCGKGLPWTASITTAGPRLCSLQGGAHCTQTVHISAYLIPNTFIVSESSDKRTQELLGCLSIKDCFL